MSSYTNGFVVVNGICFSYIVILLLHNIFAGNKLKGPVILGLLQLTNYLCYKSGLYSTIPEMLITIFFLLILGIVYVYPKVTTKENSLTIYEIYRIKDKEKVKKNNEKPSRINK